MPTIANQIEISTLLYQDDQACWVAQGLEYDITAVAASLPELPDRFAMKVAAEVAISLDLGLAPLEGIKSAPEKFWRMFNATNFKVNKETPPLRLENQAATPRIVSNMRVGELAQAA